MAELYTGKLLARLADHVASLAGDWGLSPGYDVRLLNISENATFLARGDSDDDALVFRVYRPGYHTDQEIHCELAWIGELRRDRVLVTPEPVRTVRGDHLATFECDGRVWRLAGFRFMSGDEPEPNNDLPAWFARLGEISARLHRHTLTHPPKPGFVRKTWTFETMLGEAPIWGDWRDAMGLTGEGRLVLTRCADRLREDLAAYGRPVRRFGLIHADLRLANLLIDGDQLGVIDFDDCGFCWFIYDFAAAISFIETDPIVPALRDAWVTGYSRIRALDDADLDAIPTFVMLRRMLLTAWLASHGETPTARELGTAYTDGTVRLADDYISARPLTWSGSR